MIWHSFYFIFIFIDFPPIRSRRPYSLLTHLLAHSLLSTLPPQNQYVVDTTPFAMGAGCEGVVKETVAVPYETSQEANMIKNFVALAALSGDERRTANAKWEAISYLSQILMDALMESGRQKGALVDVKVNDESLLAALKDF